MASASDIRNQVLWNAPNGRMLPSDIRFRQRPTIPAPVARKVMPYMAPTELEKVRLVKQTGKLTRRGFFKAAAVGAGGAAAHSGLKKFVKFMRELQRNPLVRIPK